MFRFTIRELVILTLLVAIGIGWWIDHRTLSKTRRETFDDAVALAQLTSGRVLGLENADLVRLQKKYGADPESMGTLHRLATE